VAELFCFVFFKFVYCVQSYVLRNVNAFCKVICFQHIKGGLSIVPWSCILRAGSAWFCLKVSTATLT
jgi:hypothetical protein